MNPPIDDPDDDDLDLEAEEEDRAPSPKSIREIGQHLRHVLAICWELAQSQRQRLLISYIGTLALEGLGLALSWLISQLITRASTLHASGSALRPDLVQPALMVLGLWILMIGIDFLRETNGSRARAQLERDLPLQALDRLLHLDRSFYQNNNAGRLNAKMTRGSAYVSADLNLLQFNLLPRLTLLACTILILCGLYPGFTVFTVAILTYYAWLLLLGRLKTTKFYDERELRRAKAERLGSEAIDNVDVVRAFHREQALLARIRRQRDKMLALQVEENRLGMRNWVTRALGGDHIQWLMLMLALYLQQTRQMSLPVFLFTVTLVMRYRQELFNFGWMYDEFMEKSDAILKLHALLNQKPRIVDPANPLPMPTPAQASLTFEGVSYRYPSHAGQEGSWALRDVSFEVKAGTVLGLAGRSGNGKSTLINLISRTDDPTHGRILLNGVDIAHVKRQDLCGRLAIVEQDPKVFRTTLAANVDFGRGFSQAEIEEACKMAGIHEYIMGLPKGYRSRIGEHGTTLSGGQQQRLCLARALVGRPSLLILDEATSSIDPYSIECIMQAMEALKGELTMIVVSHQLSTLQRLTDRPDDRIAVVRDGQIAEIGTHAQLLQYNGLYHQLVSIQQLQERMG